MGIKNSLEADQFHRTLTKRNDKIKAAIKCSYNRVVCRRNGPCGLRCVSKSNRHDHGDKVGTLGSSMVRHLKDIDHT